MSRPKKHHVVPQSYLRRFTRRGERLFVLDKPSARVFNSHIRDVAHENGFHDVSDPRVPGLNGPLVETRLSRIESMFAQASEKALREFKWLGRLDPSLKVPIAGFMALQFVRTVDKRASFGQVRELAYEELRKRFGITREEFDNVSRRVIVPEGEEKLAHIGYMLNPRVLNEHAKVFYNHMWVIGENSTGHALYTSDAPVVKHAHYEDPIFGSSGIASKGIEIAFPLSSRYVLMLYERTAFRDWAQNENLVIQLEPPHVEFYNSMQVAFSRRQVYCEYDDFDQARMMIERDPALRDPNRPLVKIFGGVDDRAAGNAAPS